jgi:hypothetical protein
VDRAVPSRSTLGRLLERRPEEEADRDDDGGVGDVEGGPVVLADVEIQEVDDVAETEAVGDVAEDARKDEGRGEAGECWISKTN